MAGEMRRLFGDRDWRGQTIAVLSVAVGAAVLGFTAGSLGRQVQSTRLARAEAANVELRESVATLEEAVREGRGPLERRIHELEQDLAESAGAAAAQGEAEQPLRARISELEAELAQRDAGSNKLANQVERLKRAVKQAERGRGELKAENQRLAAQVASLERSAAPPRAPAVEANPLAPPAARAPTADAPDANDGPDGTRATDAPAPTATAGCAALEETVFALAVAGDPVRRLGDQLVMRLAEGPDGLTLELGEERKRYPLDPLPQHVSFDCAGTPYIVSVCRVEADEAVTGVVWQADSWRDPCR